MFTRRNGSSPISAMDLNPLYFHKLQLGHILFITHMIGTYSGKKIARYIRDHNPNRFAHSNTTFVRTIHRIYSCFFPEDTKRKHFIEVSLPDNFSMGFHTIFLLCLITKPFDEGEASTAMQLTTISINSLILTYFIGRIRKTLAEILPFPFDASFGPTGFYNNVGN